MPIDPDLALIIVPSLFPVLTIHRYAPIPELKIGFDAGFHAIRNHSSLQLK